MHFNQTPNRTKNSDATVSSNGSLEKELGLGRAEEKRPTVIARASGPSSCLL